MRCCSVADNDVADVPPLGPPSRAEFDALTSRVDAMEISARRPATSPEAAADRVATLDRDQRASRARSSVVTIANPLLHMGLPTYMATSLTQVEDALLHRDIALHAGDDDIARDLEERAAGLACIALTRAADDLQFPPDVPMDQPYIDFLHGGEGLQLEMSTFADQEVHLLGLVGLSRELAVKHFDAALDAFRLSTLAISTEEDVRTALKAGADTACSLHELLAQGRRAAEGTRRRRRRLRRVLVALGGGVIAVANSFAVPLIGPVAVGVSMVLGSGAAGAAANVFED
jgi:hypothetical protein